MFFGVLNRCLPGAIMAALATDLLYLYYVGAWHEPILAVEISEIVLLYVLIVWGITWTVCVIRKAFRRKEWWEF